MTSNRMTPQGYDAHFDETGFWTSSGARRGMQLVLLRRLLVLYYCLKDSSTPVWAKATIVGALGYYVLSIQTVAIPLLGTIFLDDAGIIAGAFATVTGCLKQRHYVQADQTLLRLLHDPGSPEIAPQSA